MQDNELNDLSHRVIGIAIDIHKKLGPGFQEKIYEEALLKEFENAGIGFEKQKVVRVDYDGINLGSQRMDLLVNGAIILEIKACTQIIPLHRDQLISYLKTAYKKAGIDSEFRQKQNGN
jgi:GxxExxY protein